MSRKFTKMVTVDLVLVMPCSFFHAAGKYCWVRFMLNICLRTGIKILEQPFMIKPGISSPIYLEGFVDIRIRNKSKGCKFRMLQERGKFIQQWLL
jgi:hypothetical protein